MITSSSCGMRRWWSTRGTPPRTFTRAERKYAKLDEGGLHRLPGLSDVALAERRPDAGDRLARQLPWILQVLMPYAHVLSFAVLAVLAMSVRWPVPRWAIVLADGGVRGADGNPAGIHRHGIPDWRDWCQRPGGHRHRHGAVLDRRAGGRPIHQVDGGAETPRFRGGFVR